MLRFALIAVAAIGLAAGGLKLYLSQRIAEVADRAAQGLSMFADMRYDGTTSSFTGDAGIENVRILPTTMAGEVRAESVVFHAPNLWFLLNAAGQLEEGQMPERIGLSVNGVEIEWDDPLIQPLVDSNAALGALPVDALGCGALERFGATELRAMGYHRLRFDMRVDVRMGVDREQFEIDVELHRPKMYRLAVETMFELRSSAKKLTSLAAAQPRIGELQIDYTDEGYGRRRNEFCAEEIGEPVDAFVERHVRQVQRASRRQGVELGPKLVQAYRRFAAEPGSVQLAMQPSGDVGLSQLQQYPPREWIYLIDPRLSVNGQQVPEITLTPVSTRMASSADGNDEPPADSPASATARTEGERASSAAQAQPRPSVSGAEPEPGVASDAGSGPRGYHELPLAELNAHIGDVIRLRTQFGHEYTGKLLAIDGDTLRIERHLHGGEMTLPVERAQLERVWLRP